MPRKQAGMTTIRTAGRTNRVSAVNMAPVEIKIKAVIKIKAAISIQGWAISIRGWATSIKGAQIRKMRPILPSSKRTRGQVNHNKGGKTKIKDARTKIKGGRIKMTRQPAIGVAAGNVRTTTKKKKMAETFAAIFFNTTGCAQSCWQKNCIHRIATIISIAVNIKNVYYAKFKERCASANRGKERGSCCRSVAG